MSRQPCCPPAPAIAAPSRPTGCGRCTGPNWARAEWSTASAGKPSCNWGQLTAGAIANGFPQGAHASDPSDDGHGPGTADEPRVGLANVAGQGDLNATCEAIAAMLP